MNMASVRLHAPAVQQQAEQDTWGLRRREDNLWLPPEREGVTPRVPYAVLGTQEMKVYGMLFLSFIT